LDSRKRVYKTVENSDCIYINLAKNRADTIIGILTSLDVNVLVFIPAGKFLSKANQIRLLEYVSNDNVFWGWFSPSDIDKNKFRIMAERFNFIETGMFLTNELFFSIGGEDLSNFSDFKKLYSKLNARLVPQKALLPLLNKNKRKKI
jgi:hypothetical protein